MTGIVKAIDVKGAVVQLDGDMEGYLRADVFHAVARQFGSAQIAFDVAVERDHGALGIDRLDRALDDAALVDASTR